MASIPSDSPVYQEPYYQDAAPTVRLSARPAIFISIAARFLICLGAIWMGIQIATHSNDGVAVLAALACGGVIYGLLGRARE